VLSLPVVVVVADRLNLSADANGAFGYRVTGWPAPVARMHDLDAASDHAVLGWLRQCREYEQDAAEGK
jgi:hypothetical protein